MPREKNTQFPNECMYDLPWTKRNELANYRSELIKLMATKIFTCCYQNKLWYFPPCSAFPPVSLVLPQFAQTCLFLPSHSPMGTGTNWSKEERRVPLTNGTGNAKSNKWFKTNPLMTSAGDHPRNHCYLHIWWDRTLYECSWEENYDGIQRMIGVRPLPSHSLSELTIHKEWGQILKIQTESIERSEERLTCSWSLAERNKLSVEAEELPGGRWVALS